MNNNNESNTLASAAPVAQDAPPNSQPTAPTDRILPFFSPYSARPSSTEQATYLLTGALAGLSILPLELGLSPFKPPFLTNTLRPFLAQHLPHGLYRPAIRFWAFDLARARLMYEAKQAGISTPPAWLIGGISGAIGGLAEVFVQHIITTRSLATLPPRAALGEQAAKLGLCFGSYTALAGMWAESERAHRGDGQQVQGPPRPFWKCWMYGAMAGAFGSGIIWVGKEGLDGGKWYQDGKRGGARMGGRWWKGLAVAGGKGALIVGTVISVQVTSCREVLDVLEE